MRWRLVATLGWVLLGLALLCAAPRPAAAESVAVSFSNLTGAAASGSVTGGWGFIVNSPITVTQLGVFDSGQDGLRESHPVGIFDLSANLLVSGTVTTGDPHLQGPLWVPGALWPELQVRVRRPRTRHPGPPRRAIVQFERLGSSGRAGRGVFVGWGWGSKPTILHGLLSGRQAGVW
jgi:hypothetical protein